MKISHIFWAIFYVLTGIAVIGAGVYLLINGGDNIILPIFLIVIGPIIWHEAYTLIRDRNKPQ